MALEKYNEKRNFKNTPEPSGVKSDEGKMRFVVQKHLATRLHFDFRIETDGVLKSWAVPKGVPTSSKEKHLAMMVEDHPVNYYDFEGTIPEGNYGAGTVMVWDLGKYQIPNIKDQNEADKAIADGLEKGEIKLELFGKKLHGLFALVRFKKAGENAWLFIKDKDEFDGTKIEKEALSAKSGKSMEEIENTEIVWESNKEKRKENKEEDNLTNKIENLKSSRLTLPMLASVAEKPFDNKDWIFESKMDGYRAIAVLENGKAKLFSRNQINLNSKYPSLIESLEKINVNAIIDGEISVLNKKKVPQFELLQDYPNSQKGDLVYTVFDLLSLDNLDLRTLPLIERKKALAEFYKKVNFEDNIVLQDYVETKGKTLFTKMIKKGFEGVVAKKADSIYRSGERSDDWKKFKKVNELDCLICGYTKPTEIREHFGSLLLGTFQDGNLKYIGNTGSGFDNKSLKEIRELLDKHRRDSSPFKYDAPVPNSSVFVEPILVCEVNYAEVTKEGMLRQAIFQRIRDDKKPDDLTELSIKNYQLPARLAQSGGRDESQDSKTKHDPLELISNPQKIYWPKDKYTKKDLAKFYLEISDFILPYLKDRPQNMNRHPDGIEGVSFYHKDLEQSHPDFVKTYGIYSGNRKRIIDYILCNNVETLIYMVNLGCIEINPWDSRIDSIENPDYMIFDVDPNDADFKYTIKVALEIHELLDKIEVDNYIKTSGKRGLHIYTPLGTKYTYEQSKQFSEIISISISKRLPNIVSLERSPDKRKGKVYIDFLQNRSGQTTASVYSVRPVVKASVSTPLKWSEVNNKLDVKDYTIKTLSKRLDKMGDLWKPVVGKGINLEKSIRNLQSIIA
ncbi:MAG: DNA ligase D [Candidatus Dojkabacteria bacterium]